MIRGLLVLALSVLSVSSARAACITAACPDVTAIDAARTLVASACSCATAKGHDAYVKCARTVIKAELKAGRLTKPCKQAALHCEAQSSCGRAHTAICCAMKRGKVKAKMIRAAAVSRCAGTMCEEQGSLSDACTDQGACAARARGIRSFRSVQGVFKTSCALSSCHSTFARQGALVLETEDVSYSSLVGHPAALAEAKTAGLLRVKPGDPENSFLIRKLRGQGPGLPMPQVGQTLPEPVIQMIEDWIRRGAHSVAEECKLAASGSEDGKQYCDDQPGQTGDYHWEPLPPLEMPAAGEGTQLYAPPRPVAPGTEWETCYAVRKDWAALGAEIGLPTGQLPVIKQQTYRMHPGSHHLLLYAYVGADPDAWPHDTYFPCVAANCVNPADCPKDLGLGGSGPRTGLLLPVGGTQVAGTRYEVKYPEGVGIPVLRNDMVLIVNEHYTNPFQPPQPIYGEAWLNLYFYKANEYKALLDGIFAINYAGLLVEPYQTRTISSIWKPTGLLTRAPEDAAIFQLFGHMHKRGTEFRIDYVKDGHCANDANRVCGRDSDCGGGATCTRGAFAEDTTIYYTTAWDQAPIVDFPSPYFRVAKNEGLRWTCTHTNGITGDPEHPPKKCTEGCEACGWTGGRCSTNGALCNPASGCSGNQTCVPEGSGYSPSGFICENNQGTCSNDGAVNCTSDGDCTSPGKCRKRQGDFCCPETCAPSDDARTCWFTRGVDVGYEKSPRAFAEGQPMPLVFGQLADDDMCNMFGYFINQADLPKIGLQ